MNTPQLMKQAGRRGLRFFPITAVVLMGGAVICNQYRIETNFLPSWTDDGAEIMGCVPLFLHRIVSYGFELKILLASWLIYAATLIMTVAL
jgi:hypothetical protein